MKAVDLFCGCGGLSLGMKAAGMDVAGAFDGWDKAVSVYAANFPGVSAGVLDLSDEDEAVGAVLPFGADLLAGGPPCQDFSHAGGRVEGGRADLTVCFANVVARVSPKWFLMENVPRARGSKAFAKAMGIFAKAGYGVSQVVLEAAYCGVPQWRKRLFCIGEMGASDGLFEPLATEGLSARETTLRDYFGDDLGFEHFYRHPTNYARRAVFSTGEPSPTIRGMNRAKAAGYHGHPGDSAPHEGVRPMTTAERAMVQTFPRDFVWPAKGAVATERMIGNAVAPKQALFVARLLAQRFSKVGV